MMKHEGFKSLPLLACSLVLPVLLGNCQKKQETTQAKQEEQQEQPVETAEQSQDATGEVAIENPEAPSEQVPADAAVSPDVTTKATEPTAVYSYTVTDPSAVNIRSGPERPQVGDVIHTYQSVPSGACGTFWVQDDEGVVDQVSICTGDHAGGH